MVERELKLGSGAESGTRPMGPEVFAKYENNPEFKAETYVESPGLRPGGLGLERVPDRKVLSCRRYVWAIWHCIQSL